MTESSTKPVRKYVGVTGLPGAGKGAFVDCLRVSLEESDTALRHYSLSDILRDYVRAQGLPVERPVLREIGNQLRLEGGSGVLSQMVIARVAGDLSLHEAAVIVIDSIRAPGEITALRAAWADQFTMVAIEAPLEVLVERISRRARTDENQAVLQNRQAAVEMLQREQGLGEPEHGHSIGRCIEMADWHIDNDGSFDHLREQVEAFVKQEIFS